MGTAAALTVAGLYPLWLPLLPTGGIWLALALALGGGLAACRQAGRGWLPAAAAPPYLLPLLVLVFYALIPLFFTSFVLDGPRPLPEMTAREARALATLGPYDILNPVPYTFASPAMVRIIAFASLALLIALVFDRLLRPDVSPCDIPAGPPPARALALTIGAGLAFQAGKALEGLPPLLVSLTDALPAVICFGLALLGRSLLNRATRGPQMLWWLGAAVGLCLLLPFQLKGAAFFLGLALVSWFWTARGRNRLVGLVLLTVLPLGALSAVQITRGLSLSPLDTVRAKIVLRQAETLFCLDYVLREAQAEVSPWRSGPGYFAAVLVPRAIWPDKPNLSHGAEYTLPFCGITSPGHSASITLIGEPILRGGRFGPLVAGLVLAGLAGLTLAAWKSRRPLLAAAALGLSPWLVDFDQDFSLYLGNAARGALALAAAALLLTLSTRVGSRRGTTPPPAGHTRPN